MTDLHMHTTFSDGSDSIPQLLKKAQAKGLKLISVTDHNTIEAYNELARDGVRQLFSGEIISGVELNTVYNKETIEILGYDIDPDKIQPFIKANYPTESVYDGRLKIFNKVYGTYKELGCKFSDRILQYQPADNPRKFIYTDILRFKENEKFFLKSESMTDYVNFLRNEAMNPKSRLFVDLNDGRPSPAQVTQAIHAAGGIALLAHPFIYTENVTNDLESIVKDNALDGIEAYYSKFTPAQREWAVSFCEKRGLLFSGGSDYHGDNRPGIELGTGCGDFEVDGERIKAWTKRCKRY